MIPINPIPGETSVCRTYPITINGQTLIEFIDTPGFMNPQATLKWLEKHPGGETIRLFRAEHSEIDAFRYDNELLRPIEEGAGIIYVVDGSCPINGNNRAEMEILRLSGAPRVALINSKEENRQFLEKWKEALNQHFNIIWEFNAHCACFAERIQFLEALKGTKQEWCTTIDQAINSLRADWDERLHKTTDLICDFLKEVLGYEDTINCDKANQEEKEKELQDRFCKKVMEREHDFHEQIRKLFKHNATYQPPPDLTLRGSLFSEDLWHRIQTVEGAVSENFDYLPHLPVCWFLPPTGDLRPMRSSSYVLRIGPLYDLQFFFILLDRALIFLSHVINWTHGRREPPSSNIPSATSEEYVARWPAIQYFKALKDHEEKEPIGKEALQGFQTVLMEVLHKISSTQKNEIFTKSASNSFFSSFLSFARKLFS